MTNTTTMVRTVRRLLLLLDDHNDWQDCDLLDKNFLLRHLHVVRHIHLDHNDVDFDGTVYTTEDRNSTKVVVTMRFVSKEAEEEEEQVVVVVVVAAAVVVVLLLVMPLKDDMDPHGSTKAQKVDRADSWTAVEDRRSRRRYHQTVESQNVSDVLRPESPGQTRLLACLLLI